MTSRWGAWVTVAMLGFGLAGCETVGDLFSAGGNEEKLPGERISIMTLEQSLEADPRIADLRVVLPKPYENENWAQPGGFADNVLHHLEAGPLNMAWKRDAGEGSGGSARLASAPIVAGGRAYILDADADLRAFDAQSGEQLWRADLTPDNESDEEGRGGGVAFEDGKVFATTGFGQVVALDAATGAELWRQGVGVPYRAAPTVNGGRVFTITSDNQTVVLAAANGEVLWRHQGITEAAGILAATSAAVSGSIVIVPYSSGELFALRVENGNVLWSDSLTRTGSLSSLTELNDIAGRPVIDRGRVYAVSHSGRMVAIDIRTGERVWTRNISGVQTPWVAGDFIYLVTTEAELLCLSRRDGRVRWISQLARFRNEEARRDPIQWSGPILAGDRLVLGSSRGLLMSVSPYDGEKLGSFEIDEPVYIAPIVAKGTLYVLTDDGDLAAFR